MQYWPKTEDQKKQALAFAIGEGTSYVSAPGALVFCEDVFPDQMDNIKRTLSKSIIEPNLAFFEKASSLFGIKKHEGKTPDASPPPDPAQRAYGISDTIVKFSVANFLGGSAVSLVVQTAAERSMKVPNFPTGDKIMMRVTETIGHYGSAIILGTIFSPFAERSKEVVAKIFKNMGISGKDADNIGFAMVYTVVPEFVGTVVGWLTMTRIMGKSMPPARA